MRRRSSSTPASRAEARRLIVQRANLFKVNSQRRRWRWQFGVMPTLLSIRQLQLAVCICRRNQLVDDAVLEAAGFRPGRRRSPVPSAAAA